jgi:hypothetical protein
MYKKLFLAFSLIISINVLVFSQSKQMSVNEILGQNNVIVSAVPFLTIAPDSRSGAMGDAGVALSPDANSMHWNPAKYAFIDNEMGVSISYTPWLKSLVPDMDLYDLSFYKRIDKQQVIAASLLYFSLGDIEFTDNNGEFLKTARPNEFSLDVAYARAFGKKFSGGLAFRYIRSDLSNGFSASGVDTKAGTAFAADVSAFYTDKIKLSGYDGHLAFGINISNIGNKMSYTDGDQNKDFLPINLRLGTAVSMDMDKYNAFTVAVDFNKLMVPTSPVYQYDSISKTRVIVSGKDPNVGVPTGMFRSFGDAPGGFREELHEVTYSIGLEYLYRKQFAIRGGYFHEYETKGNRKYFTTGIGLKFNVFGLDVSYLIPQNANNPLAKSLRFTLNFDFNAFRKLNNRH